VNKTPPPLRLGFPPAWESDATTILHHAEQTYGTRFPSGELTRRVLQKLDRFRGSKRSINNREHFGALLRRMILQALLDYGRQQSRHHEHFVYDYAFDFATPETGLPENVKGMWEEVLGEDSPLDKGEKLLLRTALEDPNTFITKRGPLNQSALAGHFGIGQTSVRKRWTKIVRKIAAWRTGQTPELEVSL
jgi:hypothetical protein